MSSKQKRGLFLFGAIALACAAFVGFFELQDYLSNAPTPLTFAGASNDLQSTIVVPTLNTPLEAGKSAVWSAAFQLAWNELTNVFKAPIRITGADAVCQDLNQGLVSTKDLAPDIYYANVGFAEDGTEEKIRQDMNRQFPGIAVPDFGKGNIIVAFAYLQASLRFDLPYFDDYLTFKDSDAREARVKAFGIRGKDEYGMFALREQIEVVYCTDFPPKEGPVEFALDICKTSKPHQILLARMAKPRTLKEAVDKMQSWIKDRKAAARPKRFGDASMLLIPTMNWKIEHRFRELEGKTIQQPALSISRSFQSIHFKLDKGGAELTSTAAVVVKKADEMSYIFNEPYLIMMTKRDAANPFFVMWVDNPELMAR